MPRPYPLKDIEIGKCQRARKQHWCEQRLPSHPIEPGELYIYDKITWKLVAVDGTVVGRKSFAYKICLSCWKGPKLDHSEMAYIYKGRWVKEYDIRSLGIKKESSG